jgi:NADPH2:quinone reductase
VAFDGVGGEIGRAAFGLVRAGGRFVVMGMAGREMAVPDPAEAARRGVTVIGLWTVPLTPADQRALARDALAEAVAGRLRPTVGQAFPLARAADAHTAIEARATIGKTLLIP